MEESSLPAEVLRVIDVALESMDHVEVLFLIYRQGSATVDELAEASRVERGQLTRVLRSLERTGFVTNGEGTYRVTTNANDRAAVDAFAQAYNARPVSLIRAVYARPSPLRSFSDAFRLRRED